MAHRTDLIQVHKNYPASNVNSAKIIDPNCGKELTRREARSVLFRQNETLYFCSAECCQEYLRPKTHEEELPKAA